MIPDRYVYMEWKNYLESLEKREKIMNDGSWAEGSKQKLNFNRKQRDILEICFDWNQKETPEKLSTVGSW